MIPKHVKHNASAIARYLELVYPHYERSGNVTDLPPLNRKYKSEGDAPIGPHALRLMHNNRGTSMVLSPYLEELKLRTDKWRGVYYRDVLSLVIYDPGIVRRLWKSPETDEDASYGECYEKMRLHLAYLIEARYPGLELVVTTDPDDEPAEPPSPITRSQAGNKARWGDVQNKHTRYRNLVREVDEIRSKEGCSDKNALAIWNERRPKKENVSTGTLSHARSYVKGQLVEGRDGSIGYSRMLDEEAAS